MRHAIEPAAAVHAARRGDAASIAAIGAALETMRTAEKPSEAFFAADAAFHDAILLASGNAVFDRLGTVLGPLMRTSFEAHFRGVEAALVEPARIAAAVQFSLGRHAEVYRAIRDRDPVGARAATEALLAQYFDGGGLRDPAAGRPDLIAARPARKDRRSGNARVASGREPHEEERRCAS